MKLKYPEYEYLEDYCMDRDVDIRCQTVKIVTCRKEHECHGCGLDGIEHIINPGDLARMETALVNQEFWGSCYSCIPSMDRWLDLIIGDDDEETPEGGE